MPRKTLCKKLIEDLYLRQSNNLAYYDQMCECHNRNYYERVVKARYRNKSVFVSIIDLNSLKEINNTLGHAHADKMLHVVSKALQGLDGCLECCRIGGDEFLVISNKVCDFTALNMALTAEHNISVSYGTAYSETGSSLDTSYKVADDALYIMKRQYWQTHDRRHKEE